MLNFLTNIRLDSNAENPCIKGNKSIIGFDFSSSIPEYQIKNEANDYIITFNDVSLNMPEGLYKDDDGIIKSVLIKGQQNRIDVCIKLSHKSEYEIETINGIPSKLNFYIDRTPLIGILKGKRILINPVYKETTKSPTKLMPHVPMKGISNKLKTLLSLLEAYATITWKDSYNDNILNGDFSGDMLINLYTEASLKNESGFKVYYSKDNKESKRFAEILNKTIEGKSPLRNLGIFPKEYNYKNKDILIVTIVPAIENNRLDDAHLRDIDYRSKIAQAVFNGIIEYYS
ncbi:N-acetylmuramoyl-L-alanine amidase [Thermoanaerobacterium sp. RBIITD]|uniref:N-acetylmuramoyl-L-alanine amidase family protein n=1 Tax=Thermoanaerobacterium sp. RBIITD TaxID=1550240 RepID=UPI000BB6B9EE|nr:N-acetylmuramoyl-L-alanine amidase [Thermoanaerobacterium sp. RBIITD]SNX54317.1 N-acetylmuramoyl-L-alanine amidase [Thermoanaerobacterium sp. RBIITD]